VVRFLLDEHIAARTVAALQRQSPRLQVAHLAAWEGGRLRGCDDAALLEAAAAAGLTLVTYDCRTVPRLLKDWAEQGRHHGGVVLVDHRTLRPSDIGGLVKARAHLATLARAWDWGDRVVYLPAARPCCLALPAPWNDLHEGRNQQPQRHPAAASG
jgi:hypothetical protein